MGDGSLRRCECGSRQRRVIASRIEMRSRRPWLWDQLVGRRTFAAYVQCYRHGCGRIRYVELASRS